MLRQVRDVEGTLCALSLEEVESAKYFTALNYLFYFVCSSLSRNLESLILTKSQVSSLGAFLDNDISVFVLQKCSAPVVRRLSNITLNAFDYRAALRFDDIAEVLYRLRGYWKLRLNDSTLTLTESRSSVNSRIYFTVAIVT